MTKSHRSKVDFLESGFLSINYFTNKYCFCSLSVVCNFLHKFGVYKFLHLLSYKPSFMLLAEAIVWLTIISQLFSNIFICVCVAAFPKFQNLHSSTHGKTLWCFVLFFQLCLKTKGLLLLFSMKVLFLLIMVTTAQSGTSQYLFVCSGC